MSYNVDRNLANPPRYILLTLTTKNCNWEHLQENIARMMEGWKKLSRRVVFRRAVLGWARTFEVTRGRDGKAHPHFHVLLEVPPEYFQENSALYLEHDALVRLWGRCLGVDYAPSVDVRAVRRGKIGGAIAEVTKYLAKGSDIEGLDDEEFEAYASAIAGVRAWGCGGSFREADAEMEAEELLRVGGAEEHGPRCDCPLCGRKLLEIIETWDDTIKAYVVTRNEHAHEWEDYATPRAGPTLHIVNNGGVVNIVEASARIWGTGAKIQTGA